MENCRFFFFFSWLIAQQKVFFHIKSWPLDHWNSLYLNGAQSADEIKPDVAVDPIPCNDGMYWTRECCLKFCLPRSPSNAGNTADEADKADKDIRCSLLLWGGALLVRNNSFIPLSTATCHGYKVIVILRFWVHLCIYILGYSYHDAMDVLHIIPFACFWLSSHPVWHWFNIGVGFSMCIYCI